VKPAPHDQADRDRALDPRASFHLTAPAGSGKTAVLLARFLKLLAQVSDPREVLVLTFTRKAAGEFRERAMRYFWGRTPAGPDLPSHEKLLLDLAGQVLINLERKNLATSYLMVPERLPVTTFHAFCVQLLRAAPHEAGVPLDFKLLEDETEAAWSRQEALEELRRRLHQRPAADPVRQALVQRLVRLNNNWPRLARELSDLLARRDTLKDFLALAQRSLKEQAFAQMMEQRLSQVVLRTLIPLAQELKECGLEERWPQFREAAGPHLLPEKPPGVSPVDVPAWQALAQLLLTQRGDRRQKWTNGLKFGDWPKFLRTLPEGFVDRLRDCRLLPQVLFSPEEITALHDLILLLNEAWKVYEELCQKRRVLDFVAVEEAALRLLSDESLSDLLLRLDLRLRHLLVDEFQDTSDNQMELLCRLVSGWASGDGRTITVVGDPKQSIYGWRKARLPIFLESREGLKCEGGRILPLTPLSLTTNFRATATLITWVNEIFGGTIMAAARGKEGLIFEAACPPPENTGGETPLMALFAGEDRQEARLQEARWLAFKIKLCLGDLPPGGKVAVLLFTRTQLPAYLGALKKAGLVPRVREGLRLKDSRVVAHLHNLARALVRPQDDVAWAAVLTGPWTNPNLGLLAACAQAPGRIWPDKLMALAENYQTPEALAFLSPLLLASRERVGREPLAHTLERFLDDSGAWQGIAAWEGALGVASARTYLKLLEEANTGLPEATFEKADFALEGAYQPPDPRAADSPLEVLTIHGAKGLEFHTVFVPFLDWQPLRMRGNQPPPFLLEEIPGTPHHVLALAPPYWQRGKDSSYQLVKRLYDARILAEARRVFYVAVTRAEARLFLSGVLTSSGGHWLAPNESPLSWLFQHYQARAPVPGTSRVWGTPPLRVEVCPAPAAPRRPSMASGELPEAWAFTPEPSPYRLIFPSEAAGPEGPETPGDPGGLVEHALHSATRARGEVTHRLLETLARKGGLPGPEEVAAALRSQGLDRERAFQLAPEILAEVRTCCQEPFLKKLLSAREAITEWLLEDQAAFGVVRRGRPDLLAFDGEVWWLVDFKTSRPQPGETWEDFLAREREKYLPQLLAYREMVAKAKGISELEAIRLALYFTAGPRAEMLEVFPRSPGTFG
jgi:ATP-dependent exoDNAse (exonuclease V) beta subunit